MHARATNIDEPVDCSHHNRHRETCCDNFNHENRKLKSSAKSVIMKHVLSISVVIIVCMKQPLSIFIPISVTKIDMVKHGLKLESFFRFALITCEWFSIVLCKVLRITLLALRYFHSSYSLVKHFLRAFNNRAISKTPAIVGASGRISHTWP